MWTMIREQLTAENGEVYAAYGVTNGNFTVHDFCVDRAETERFVGLLNANDASDANVIDVIEDYLAVR